ncbi:MAG: hypothetical protein ACO1OO_12990 [Flavisolibacter sp.]
MELVPIFVDEKSEETNGLWAIRYGNGPDEFERLFDLWNEVEYLEIFYHSHADDLNNVLFESNSVPDVVLQTIQEANELEDTLSKLAFGNDGSNLQHLFKPLDNQVFELSVLQKSKASIRTRWRPHPKLRIYAIRLAPNLYIITGGAIKLTHRMDERPHTQEELRKIERVRQWLQSQGIYEPEDLNNEDPL